MSKSEQLLAFQQLVNAYFEKVRKHLPKQYSSFKDMMNRMSGNQRIYQDLLRNESEPKLGRYAIVVRLTMAMKSSKLREIALNFLYSITSCGFIDGQQEDCTNEFFLEEFAELFEGQEKKPSLMDALIYSVTQCLVEKDELIVHAIKVLLAFVQIQQVSPISLVRLLRTIVYVYTQSKTQLVDQIAKSALTEMVNLTFSNMEQALIAKKRRSTIKDDATTKICSVLLLQIVDVISLEQQSLSSVFEKDVQKNERGTLNGQFGWCVLCREAADYFCKDLVIPYCSPSCKLIYQDQINQSHSNIDGVKIQLESSINCSIQLFDAICKLLSPKQPNVKNQSILLELLIQIFDIPNLIIRDHPAFIKVVKESLCGQLLKYCLETDKQLVGLSFRIFEQLLSVMRRHLKHEIAIFIDHIILKILSSVNATFYHRQVCLECLVHVMPLKYLVLELYMNYDCNMQHECILEKLILLFSEIINLKYQRPEFQSIITIPQEQSLRLLCQQILTIILHSLQEIYECFVVPAQNSETNLKEVDDDDELDQQRQLKQEALKGVALFNNKPEKGIPYLIKASVIPSEDQIAQFLRENKQLSKDAVGQYLGGHSALQIKVLGEYTDTLDFRGKTVEQALRYYLDQFTLPGEAQQVDRIVQKFSDKYFRDNEKQLLKSSDAIYTFTYLLVMLQTDLHNPNVEEKMKLSDFNKLAKGINDGEDLPADYMQATYLSIQKQPLAIHEKQKQQKIQQDSLKQSQKKKQECFQKETETLLKKTKEMMRNHQEQEYLLVDSAYLIKPLLETVGSKIFNMLISQEINDQMCKNIHIYLCLSSNYQVKFENELKDLMKQLTRFTKKNMQLIQTILSAIAEVGNSLTEASWRSIFELMSRLEELRMMQQTKAEFDVIPLIADLSIELQLMERVFMLSKNLDNDAIQRMVVALCAQSKVEVFRSQPRTFSLQKLTEVTDFNMDRVKLIWCKLWVVVGAHLHEVSIKEKRVAMFAVDCLKQLSIKFLQREELYNFQFQKDVLRPFETIYVQSDIDIKEFIMSCMHSIVLNHTLRSGWRVVFDLINFGLKEDSDKLSMQAFEIISRVMGHNLDMIQDIFTDLISTLANLGRKPQEQLALASITYVEQCLHYLSAQAQVQPKKNWDDPDLNEDEDLDQTIKNAFSVQQLETYWVPLLGMLSRLAGDKRNTIQSQSMDKLFSLLHQYGYIFSIEFWKIVFQVVLRPLFDEIQFTFQQNTQRDTSPDKESHWFKDSCKKGFNHITNLMNRYFHKLRDLLPDLLKLFENCVQNQNEKLAKFSLSAVKNMIFKIGRKFSQKDWDEITLFITKMFKTTTPHKLLSEPPKLQKQGSARTLGAMRSVSEESFTQCVSQMQLLQITMDIVNAFNDKLSKNQLEQLEENCKKSNEFARSFNGQIEQRYLMWKNGFMGEQKLLPGLLRQERESYGCIIAIKFYLKDPTFIQLLVDAIDQFNLKHKLHVELRGQKFDETAENKMNKLKQQESEREASNSRTLLDQYVLPRLLQIEIPKQVNRVLFESLLTASQYPDTSFNQKNCPDCRQCQRCQKEESTLDRQIRQCLNRLYDLIQV